MLRHNGEVRRGSGRAMEEGDAMRLAAIRALLVSILTCMDFRIRASSIGRQMEMA